MRNLNIIKPLHGTYAQTPSKFEHEGELVYITDLHLLCITDSQGGLQLMTKVVDYNFKDEFPICPNKDEIVLLYNDLTENKVYYFDIISESYKEVIMMWNNEKCNLIVGDER